LATNLRPKSARTGPLINGKFAFYFLLIVFRDALFLLTYNEYSFVKIKVKVQYLLQRFLGESDS